MFHNMQDDNSPLKYNQFTLKCRCSFVRKDVAVIGFKSTDVNS